MAGITALITAIALLGISFGFVLVAIFLLRMVRHLGNGIAILAERKAEQAFAAPVARRLEERVQQLIENSVEIQGGPPQREAPE